MFLGLSRACSNHLAAVVVKVEMAASCAQADQFVSEQDYFKFTDRFAEIYDEVSLVCRRCFPNGFSDGSKWAGCAVSLWTFWQGLTPALCWRCRIASCTPSSPSPCIMPPSCQTQSWSSSRRWLAARVGSVRQCMEQMASASPSAAACAHRVRSVK